MTRDLRGGLSCPTHTDCATCAFCGRRSRFPGPRRRDLGLLRCALCAEDAIDIQDQVRAALNDVRRVLSAQGFPMPKPTPVYLSPAAELPRTDRHHPLGVTVAGPTRGSAVVHVVAGLPTVYFHRVVAHELGHVWLARNRVGALPNRLQEGLAELLSYTALREVGPPFGPALRKRISLNPDPAHGGGFRLVRDAVRRRGFGPVLRALADDGALP
jgi:hypothetical protein